jgi:autotransporter-associated beta strand protein
MNARQCSQTLFCQTFSADPTLTPSPVSKSQHWKMRLLALMLLTTPLAATAQSDLTWHGNASQNHWNETDTNWQNNATALPSLFMSGDNVVFTSATAGAAINVQSDGVNVNLMDVLASHRFSGGAIHAAQVNVADNAVLGLTANFDDAALTATGINFNANGALAVRGFSAQTYRQQSSLIETDTAIAALPAFTMESQPNADYLSAGLSLSSDQTDILATVGLSWDSRDPTRPAHGTFTLPAATDTFSLDVPLANNTDNPNRSGWDGITLTKAGAGTLVMSANNYYTGDTNVNAGTLLLTQSGSLAGTVNVATDATFVLRGYVGNHLNAASGSAVEIYQGADVRGNLNADGSELRFFVPDNIVDDSRMLNVNGDANVDGAIVSVSVLGNTDLTQLKNGERLRLVNARRLNGDVIGGRLQLGVTTQKQFSLSRLDTDGVNGFDTLVGTLSSTPGNPDVAPQYADEITKVFSQSWLASVAFLNTGTDVIVDTLVHQAIAYSGKPSQHINFGTISGGRSRFNSSDGHNHLETISAIAGIAHSWNLKTVNLIGGGFFEFGHSNFQTHNDFNGLEAFGKGSTNYIGAGVLARVDFGALSGVPNLLVSFPYIEASVRAGRLKHEYRADDIVNNGGIVASYGRTTDKAAANYYGAHLGIGYVWDISGKGAFDMYAKLLWAYQNKDSVPLSTGETVNFDSVDSLRARLGGRYVYWFTPQVTSYFGLLYNYSFEAKSKAASMAGGSNYGIEPSEFKGSAGVAEVGITITPNNDLPMSFNFNAQGYVGERKGFVGTWRMKVVF